MVLGDAHALRQAFLNITKNSHRAVADAASRELTVSVDTGDRRLVVRFRDTGPGVSSPANLFQPFQNGATGTGLGLYVSRSAVRAFGGDLRYEPQESTCTFAVELQVA